MKKRTLVLLSTAAVLALSIAGTCGAVFTASAESITESSGSGATAETTVTYKQADSWSVTIPESLTVGGPGQEVSADNVKIEPGKNLKVSVESQNNWKVTSDGTNKEDGIPYELKSSGEKITDEVLSVEAGTGSGSKTVTAELAEGSENYSTGNKDYSDTLTFTVTVE